MTPAEIAKARQDFIDSRQDSVLKSASALEKKLFDVIIEKFIELFESNDSNLIWNDRNINAIAAIEKVFGEFESIEKKRISTQFVDDVRKITDLNIRYHKSMAEDLDAFKKVSDKVLKIMRARLGVNDEGVLRKDGFLDSFIKDSEVKSLVRGQLYKAVTNQIPMKSMIKDLRYTVLGSGDVPGAITNKFKATIFDVYQQHDRATSKIFAQHLGLLVFVYTGGLIETSRKFCIDRNNKAFTTEEAEDWINDPDLPRTRAEKDAGTIENYDPIIDCGRWRCRHHINFVSKARAKRLRPDLFGDTPPEDKPKDTPLSPTALNKEIKKHEEDILKETENQFESAVAIDSKGNVVVKKDGTKSQVAFTEEEALLLKDTVFTHNHPGSRCFSPEDLYITCYRGIKEMRAIATNSIKGNVVFKFVNKGMPSGQEGVKLLRKAYREAEAQVEFFIRGQMQIEEMTIEQANQTHHFMVMEELVKLVRNQYNYRELNNFEFSWENR